MLNGTFSLCHNVSVDYDALAKGSGTSSFWYDSISFMLEEENQLSVSMKYDSMLTA